MPRDLSHYQRGDYRPGAGWLVRGLWWFVSLVFLESGWFPLSVAKVVLLRAFGAKVGKGVVIKPHVRIKHPWRLSIGDHSWIGQDVWIDNMAEVAIAANVCVSQGVYICTGTHDHRRDDFRLVVLPVRLEDGCWICARAVLLPGVTIGSHAVVAAGAVVHSDVASGVIVGGVPARPTREPRR